MSKTEAVSVAAIQLVHRFWPLIGGIESHARLLATLLAKRGLPSVVLTPRRDRSWPEEEYLDGFCIKRFRSSSHRGLQGMVEGLGAVRALHREKPALVHCHGLAWSAVAALRFVKRRHIPSVVSIHSAASLPNPRTWRGRIARAAVRRANRVIAVSQWLADDLVQIGIERGRIHVLPNPVDANVFSPAEAGRREALRQRLGLSPQPTVVCVGRLSHEKGTDVLCDAWRRLVTRLPQTQLVVVGDGSDRPMIRDLAASCGEGTVRFVGFQDQVAPYFQAADLAVLASRREGLPCALVEAAACGVAAVATSTRGAKEVIVNGETGILVEIESSAALADQIERLIRDRVLREAMGAKARLAALRLWSVERAWTTLADVYEKATGGRLRLEHLC